MADSSPRARWQGDDYAPHAAHHRSFDDWFLQAHHPRPTDVVVDAGCGTGEFTARIAQLVPEGHVIGVEPDPSMLEQAQAKAGGNLEFRQGRLQSLDEVCDPGSADLVVSRAVFHWIRLVNYPRCYAAIHAVLKPGGWFHAESGATGNVSRVMQVLDQVATDQGLRPAEPTFPDAGTVMELLEQAGFEVSDESVTTVAQRRRFDRDGLVGFLRTQAAVAYVARAETDVRERFLAGISDRLDDFRRHDGTYDQTFVRLHVLCRRRLG
jgi:trans-aconitate methyltransferase